MNDDLISRKALKEAITKLPNANPSYIHSVDVLDREMVLDEIDNAPAVEPKKGKWKVIGFVDDYAYCKCSECGKTTRLYRDSKNEFCCIADIRNKVIACLYCGADMRSVDEGLHVRAISDLSKTVDELYKNLRGEEE